MEAESAAGQEHEGSEPVRSVDRLLGLAINKYVVEKKLGEGGMGAVYRMRHVEIPDTFLALKVLTLRAIPGDPAATREMAERFAQEARAAAAVGSHRVVQVVDVGELPDGTRYLMMEYVPGRSIGQAIAQDGPLDVRKAVLLCARVADTLALAHQRGIIHRDIKPMNLMLVDEGDDPMVKILDFGVSRATGEAKIAHTIDRKIIGSPGYMAPEAAIGTPVDGRADVFSLGATLFEMLTGQLPFRGATFQALMMATIQDPIPAASALRPVHLGPVPEAVEAVLAWGLTKDPAQRPTMAEFRGALVEAAEAMAQERRRAGPILASVMRNFHPPVSERPTLSAASAEASEILARYSTPGPARTGTPQPRGGTPSPEAPPPSGVRASEPRGGTPQPIGASMDRVFREVSAPALRQDAPDGPAGVEGRTVPLAILAAGLPAPSRGTSPLVLASVAVAVLCLTVAAVALLWPRPAPPPTVRIVEPAAPAVPAQKEVQVAPPTPSVAPLPARPVEAHEALAPAPAVPSPPPPTTRPATTRRPARRPGAPGEGGGKSAEDEIMKGYDN